METPNKIYMRPEELDEMREWLTKPYKDRDIAFIRKEALLEILDEKLKELWNASSAQADKDEYYQNPLVNQLKELINKINSL